MPGTASPIIPLVTATEIFPALEDLAWGASSELLLSFRIFDPATRLRRRALLDEGLNTWADLVAAISARGVTVRLIMTDFDLLFTRELHQNAWAHATAFARRMTGDSDVLCAAHGHAAGPFWRLALRAKIRKKLAELEVLPDADLTPVQRDVLRNGPVLRPVTLHQKFAVADGKRAVLGGLDVDERRWDDPDHRRAPEETWHDVSLSVSGPVCTAIRAHFIDCWNTALSWGSPSLCNAGQPMQQAATPQSGPMPRLVRTMSEPRHAPTALAPRPLVTEHEDQMIRAFKAARNHIYLETQFFRHKPLADALAQAASTNPDLQLVLLMPTEPDRIIFGGDDGIDARYAQALQIRNLELCKRAFGERMAVVSPAKPQSATPEQKGTLRGAGIVYVHAKVALIDDKWGLVGSANLNGRSMRWDTEAGIAFDDPLAVRGLRERLAGIWLAGHQDIGDPTRAATWSNAARLNQSRAPDKRTGFVMPYPEARNRRFARFLPILPADMF